MNVFNGAGEQAVYAHNYAEIASITILYYDHLVTLSSEIENIWSRPISRPSILFFLNRYIPFFGNMIVSIFDFTNLFTTDKSCRAYGLARQLLLVVNQIVVALVLGMRIVALYGFSRRIICLLLGVAITLICVTCWSLLNQHSELIQGVTGCRIAMSTITGIHIAVGWEAQAIFDTIAFSLTIAKTLQARKMGGLAMHHNGLLDLIYRDGALYFAVMALANVANIFTFYFASPILKGSLSTFASCISITMLSRLMLHLHEAVSPQTSSIATLTTLFARPIHTRATVTYSDASEYTDAGRAQWGSQQDREIELMTVHFGGRGSLDSM